MPIAFFAFLATRVDALRPLRLAGVLVACAWAAPLLLTCSTPVALDFLGEEFPHQSLRQPGALTSNPLINDVALQFLPWREAVRQSILSGELPLLDRSAGGGTPLLANPQAGVFYIPNLISLPLTTFAWPLFVSLTKILVALSGTYLFLKRRVSDAAATFGAIAYSCSTFTAAFLMFPHTNVTTLFPWLLLAIDDLVERDDRRAVASGAAVTAMLLAAGHPESAFHCALVAVPYGLYRAAAQRSFRALLRLGAAALLAAGLAAVALLPFIEYVPYTQRMHDIESIPGFLSTPPLDRAAFVTLLVPNYYGNPRVHNYRHALNFNELATQYAGLAALVLALLGATRRSSQRAFWLLAGVCAFFLANQPPQLAPLIERLPLLDITAHGRMRFVFIFAVAVLAAFGLDDALVKEKLRRVLAAAGVVTVIAICVLSYPTFAEAGIRRLIFFTELAALASLAVLLGRRVDGRLTTFVTALLFLDLFSITGFYNPAVGREWFYPTTPLTAAVSRREPHERFTGLERMMMPNSAVFFGASDIRPHDPMAFRPFVAALDAGGFDRSHYFGRFDSLPRKTLLDFLGVTQVAGVPGTRLSLPLTYAGPDGMLFANAAALPRFFEPAAVERVRDPAAAISSSPDARVVYSNSTAIQPEGRATIDILSFDHNSATVRVNAAHDTFVASSEAALPGWQLTRDSRRVEWETINGAFVGWKVPAGNTTWHLRYIPPGLRTGSAISLVTLLFVLFLWTSAYVTRSRVRQ